MLYDDGDVSEWKQPLSWTAHHANMDRSDHHNIATINTTFPVIYHVNFQYHIMTIAKEYTSYLNSEQTTVGCSDQPLYALKKNIQWACPKEFSNHQYFAFMGGLHIEQVALKAHGSMIKGTGLEDITKQASLATIGLQRAVTDVNDIKKARYTVHVMVPCLFKFLWSAYLEDHKSPETLDHWAANQKSTMFQYWYGVLNHQISTLMLVRSFRESNLALMICSSDRLAGNFFALDHIPYARYISVFIQDLKVLSVENPELYEELTKNMSACTSSSNFSNMAFDQKHEQNHKEIKSTSGYINLVNNEDREFLRKLEMCSPEIRYFLAHIYGGYREPKIIEAQRTGRCFHSKVCQRL